jgi:hypothetical protein
MFGLYEILRNAQGGHALDNLAAQFNMSKEEADAAVKAVVPALSAALLNHVSEPHALGSFIGMLREGRHLAAFADPIAAQSSVTASGSGEILSQILGSSAARKEIAAKAAAATGISPETLFRMLPVIVSIAVDGLAKSARNQGWGGILGQFANSAAQGGLGTILGQIFGGGQNSTTRDPQAQPQGQGPLGSILGQILGGGPSSAGQPGSGPAGGQAGLGGLLGAGLEALTKMLQPETPPPAGQQRGIDSEINQITDGKRR